MPLFAVYYVPDAGHDLYRLGSSILGYDVRARQRVPLSEELRAGLGAIEPAWVERSRKYGFHMTISDLIELNYGDLFTVEREIEDILSCFDPANPFALTRHPDRPVTLWGQHHGALTLNYMPSSQLLVFHTLIVACLSHLSGGTTWQKSYADDPSQYAGQPYAVNKIRRFGTFRGLDTWSPHFTLLNPYTGQESDRITRVASAVFEPFSDLVLSSVCLLKMRDAGWWEIHREFPLHGRG